MIFTVTDNFHCLSHHVLFSKCVKFIKFINSQIKVTEAKHNESSINGARESYRDVASRASILYFIINDLNKINPIYQFSLRVSDFAISLLIRAKSRAWVIQVWIYYKSLSRVVDWIMWRAQISTFYVRTKKLISILHQIKDNIALFQAYPFYCTIWQCCGLSTISQKLRRFALHFWCAVKACAMGIYSSRTIILVDK